MKVPKEVRESLEKVPVLMLGLSREAITFAEKITEIATDLIEEIKDMEVEES